MSFETLQYLHDKERIRCEHHGIKSEFRFLKINKTFFCRKYYCKCAEGEAGGISPNL